MPAAATDPALCVDRCWSGQARRAAPAWCSSRPTPVWASPAAGVRKSRQGRPGAAPSRAHRLHPSPGHAAAQWSLPDHRRGDPADLKDPVCRAQSASRPKRARRAFSSRPASRQGRFPGQDIHVGEEGRCAPARQSLHWRWLPADHGQRRRPQPKVLKGCSGQVRQREQSGLGDGQTQRRPRQRRQ